MMKAKTTTAFELLNPQQRRAATFGTPGKEKGIVSGPMLILAGAGTGKTNTLAHRTAHLVLNGVDPARILMLTFTRRAALEMIRRTQTIVSEVLSDRGKMGDRSVVTRMLWSGTFHSVGNRILRLFAKQLGLDPSFTVLDRTDAADLMDVIRHELGFSSKDKRFPRKDACLAIYSYRINTRLSLKQTLEEQFPWVAEWEQDLTRLYREYVGRKQKNNVLDFDDLLLYWHAMMKNPALAQSLGGNFDHVLVDEYQDTSSLQGEIIQALKPDGNGVTVVGDDAQAIYSFRAAAVENILGFADRFKPKADMVVLSQNYRSTQPILDAANALMSEGSRQHRKTLMGLRQATQKPSYVTLEDAQSQAEYIVGKLLATREVGGSLKRHAILFRSSHHSDVLELELTKRSIPFVKYGGLKFLEAAHVKDMLSILRWIDNPRNAVSGFRVLKLVPGFGPGHAKKALDYFEAQNLSHQKPGRLRRAAAEQDGLEAILYAPREARRSRDPLGRPGGPGARVVQAADGAPLRGRFQPLRGHRTAGETILPISDSRAFPDRAHARSARGHRRSIGLGHEGRGVRGPVDHSLGEGAGVGLRLRAERGRRQLPVRVCGRQA